MKTLLVISPAAKLELATWGWVAVLGKSVRKPGCEGTTVMLPVTAAALAGIPAQGVRAGSVMVSLALIGLPGLAQPLKPARVSSNRTGCGSGKNCKPLLLTIGAIVTANAREPAQVLASVAVIVKLKVPACDGVPVSAPPAARLNPFGKAPAVTVKV